MTYNQFNDTPFPVEYLPSDVPELVRTLALRLLSAWFPNAYPVEDDARAWGSIACEDVECVITALAELP